jgi:hypothetical protein
MVYNLRNGYTVSTTEVGTGTEFVTKNPAGDVISTVYHTMDEARSLVRDLRIGERLMNGGA